MNKNGQTLVLFIAFLPILLGVCALVVDVGIMAYAKIKGNSLLATAEENNYDIKEHFELNDLEIQNIKYLTGNDDTECVIIKYSVESVFGNIVGKEKYDIELNTCN